MAERNDGQAAGAGKGRPMETQAYLEVIRALDRSASKWSVPATDFYIASLLTGVRAQEWRLVCRWTLGDRPGLWAWPADAMASLGPMTRRTVMLDGYGADLVHLIDRHIERVRQCAGDAEFRTFYLACRRVVQAAASRAIPAPFNAQYGLDAAKPGPTNPQRKAIARAIGTRSTPCPARSATGDPGAATPIPAPTPPPA